MTILYVNQDIGIDWCAHSGGATHIQSIVRAMIRLGHAVHILVRKPPQRPCPGDIRIPCYASPDEVPWDIFDLVYERYSLWGELSLSRSLPWQLEINAPLIEEQIRFRTPIDVEKASLIKDAVCRRADRILIVSPELSTYVPAEARSKIFVVPNAVDRREFRPMPAPARFAFGYIGSMRPWHDLDTPLRAFTAFSERFPEADFHVVGSGPMQQLYRQSFQHPKIFFHGLIPPSAVPGVLEKMSCGVAPFIPDTPSYFSPLKIREYLAAHRTVITHPRFAEYPIVTEGVHGLEATQAAMERQIGLNRKHLTFPEIPDWESCLFLS